VKQTEQRTARARVRLNAEEGLESVDVVERFVDDRNPMMASMRYGFARTPPSTRPAASRCDDREQLT